jgi:hypothetical protein
MGHTSSKNQLQLQRHLRGAAMIKDFQHPYLLWISAEHRTNVYDSPLLDIAWSIQPLSAPSRTGIDPSQARLISNIC